MVKFEQRRLRQYSVIAPNHHRIVSHDVPFSMLGTRGAKLAKICRELKVDGQSRMDLIQLPERASYSYGRSHVSRTSAHLLWYRLVEYLLFSRVSTPRTVRSLACRYLSVSLRSYDTDQNLRHSIFTSEREN